MKDDEPKDTIYSAIPSKELYSEKSLFRKFIAWLLPQFERKRIQSESLISAKLKRTEAEARQLNAMAAKSELETLILAQSIVEKTILFEQKKSLEKSELLSENFEELKQLISVLEKKYGTTVSIVTKNMSPITIDEELLSFNLFNPMLSGTILKYRSEIVIPILRKIGVANYFNPKKQIHSKNSKLIIPIRPGSAPPRVISEILSDISLLYRKSGGGGLNFAFESIEVGVESELAL